MQAAAVDIMVKKAGFDSNVAMAVAEAFDVAMTHAQLVTVPTMDARFAAVDSKFAALESKMDARFLAVDARITGLEARMDARFALQDERIDKKFEALKSEMVRWVFLTVLGNTALSAGVNALMSAFQHFR